MFSEEDAQYAEALRMGPICAIVLDGDAKEPRIGMVTICCIAASRLINTRVCDEHLFGQVSTCTDFQLPNIPLHKCAPAKIHSPII